jgi:rRNA maturation endonuclease Nob1
MTLYKRSTRMQKVVVANLMYRCESCGHVEVRGDTQDSTSTCGSCGGNMILFSASSEESTKDMKPTRKS